MNAAKAKKTFWGRIKSWFATTWIWNTIKNLFSSNDTSKVNTANRKAQTASQPKDKGVEVGQKHKVTSTPPLKPYFYP
ncbi:hypothetical protein [Wolbachia endosymbiont of Folsomia candida]|uniref:hypothetical protein n=1 Tax=Wolbachia endosymbiont of Folsomia candida TaxID=169402 RepID=UPI000AF1755B|nr:hypothetical protein [Wolbachia endosymbiont of Folsomia candida]APR97925.1 hypothetical protein ASM33_01165 [Wolbachia endosymbiont of Folsomia candida]